MGPPFPPGLPPTWESTSEHLYFPHLPAFVKPQVLKAVSSRSSRRPPPFCPAAPLIPSHGGLWLSCRSGLAALCLHLAVCRDHLIQAPENWLFNFLEFCESLLKLNYRIMLLNTFSKQVISTQKSTTYWVLLHFTIVCALEVTYISFTCMGKCNRK